MCKRRTGNWKMKMVKKIAGKLRWKCERMAAFEGAENEPQYNLNQNKLRFIISKDPLNFHLQTPRIIKSSAAQRSQRPKGYTHRTLNSLGICMAAGNKKIFLSWKYYHGFLTFLIKKKSVQPKHLRANSTKRITNVWAWTVQKLRLRKGCAN